MEGVDGRAAPLDPKLCQVGGLNQNYTSAAGTSYHIQIEDRGPIVDPVSEAPVRRVNVVVYANYGEPTARIVYGRDHDYADQRSTEQNAFVQQEIKNLAVEAREEIEEREQTLLRRIKHLLRVYHGSKEPRYKQELDSLNALFPYLVSRAWAELKEEKQQQELSTGAIHAVLDEQVAPRVYPLDAELRATVIEIERMIQEVGQDLSRLKEGGRADDILMQTYRKLASRAEESLNGRLPSQFNVRRLEMTRESLMTTWRQVKSRLKAPTGS